MSPDKADYMIESLVVEIELLGATHSAREIITGLLVAAVEVASANDVPLDFVARLAKRVVAYGYDA